MKVTFKKIPTYNNDTNEWTYTSYKSQEEFAAFLDGIWNDECNYSFDETSFKFNERARFFDKFKYYTDAPSMSTEYKHFWNIEKEKCRRGVIYTSGDKTWYLTRDYYMWINYLPVANKEKEGIDSFVDVRDIQYHLALYEKRAEAHHLNAVLVKKRQMASSLYHCAKTYNRYVFEKNAVCKIFASDAAFLSGDEGIWKFYSKYKDFLNEHTGWYRANSPDKELSWIQRKEITKDGNKFHRGKMSVLVGISLKQSATKGVGGMCTYGYHEESGIAPHLDLTYGVFKPAVESGIYTTGMFIAAGSLGDLDECIPLKHYIYAPTSNGFLSTITTWNNKERQPTEVGLYIPEHWGFPGFIDKYGNSNKMGAYAYLQEKYRIMRNDPQVKKEDLQLTLSQKPIFLEEAFKHRKISEFPVELLQKQQERIDLKNNENRWLFKPQKGILVENAQGRVVLSDKDIPDEHHYPIKPKWEDKRGVVTIYEPPTREVPEFFTYFGGLDPIEADVTTTSDSVASLDIFIRSRRVQYKDDSGNIKYKIEGDKLVATYRGRYDTAEKTNEQMWLLIKMYNAFTLVERSKPNFINYMRRLGREKYLARESDIPLFKDINVSSALNTVTPFGFIISGHNQMWKYLKENLKEYLKQEFSYIYKKDTEEVLRPLRGIDRIDDYWLLEELIQYNDVDNFDRLISFSAALALCKIYEINNGIQNTSEVKQEIKEVRYIPQRSYNMLGNGSTNTNNRNNKRKSLL